jgi:hypothetical protein
VRRTWMASGSQCGKLVPPPGLAPGPRPSHGRMPLLHHGGSGISARLLLFGQGTHGRGSRTCTEHLLEPHQARRCLLLAPILDRFGTNGRPGRTCTSRCLVELPLLRRARMLIPPRADRYVSFLGRPGLWGHRASGAIGRSGATGTSRASVSLLAVSTIRWAGRRDSHPLIRASQARDSTTSSSAGSGGREQRRANKAHRPTRRGGPTRHTQVNKKAPRPSQRGASCPFPAWVLQLGCSLGSWKTTWARPRAGRLDAWRL